MSHQRQQIPENISHKYKISYIFYIMFYYNKPSLHADAAAFSAYSTLGLHWCGFGSFHFIYHAFPSQFFAARPFFRRVCGGQTSELAGPSSSQPRAHHLRRKMPYNIFMLSVNVVAVVIIHFIRAINK